MPIATTCDNCASELNAPDHTAGRRVRCPHCRQPTSIPDAPAPTPPPVAKRVPKRAPPTIASAYCTNCGQSVAPKAVACTHCGVPPKVEKNYCHHCGVDVHQNQVVCVKCGSQLTAVRGDGEKTKVIAGVLALCLGGLGIHKFYHGSWGWGIIYLILFITFVPAIVSLFEGIILLCMDSQKYDAKYNQQPSHPFKW